MAKPRRLMLIAFFMLLAGAVLPFLMVVKVLPASLTLSFISYASSVGGLFLGLIGLGALYGERKEAESKR